MPKNEMVALKSLETIQSYKSAYMDIFARCTGNREVGLKANEVAVSSSNFIRQMSDAASMNYYVPENNEELLTLVYDVVRLEKTFQELTWDRFDPLTSTVIANLQMGFDITFSAILWDEIRKIVRPDIKTSIFKGTDDETKALIEDIGARLLPDIKEHIATGLGARPLNHGKCERDCTKCPVSQNFSISNEDIATYVRARCPMFLGRQGLLVSRIFAQVQVLYRTAYFPVANSIGMRFEIEKKMIKPIEFYNQRVRFMNFILDTHFESKAVEAQGNIGFFMSNNMTNMQDIIINYAKGQVPTYIPE